MALGNGNQPNTKSNQPNVANAERSKTNANQPNVANAYRNNVNNFSKALKTYENSQAPNAYRRPAKNSTSKNIWFGFYFFMMAVAVACISIPIVWFRNQAAPSVDIVDRNSTIVWLAFAICAMFALFFYIVWVKISYNQYILHLV